MSEKGTGTNLTYSYDENGNQTGITGTSGGSNVNKTFTYTPEDMLETYTEGSDSQVNLYNGEGQRVQKKEVMLPITSTRMVACSIQQTVQAI